METKNYEKLSNRYLLCNFDLTIEEINEMKRVSYELFSDENTEL